MIKKLFVDGYKTLVDFTFEPERVTLLAGGNGAGKSSVFEVIDSLRRFIVFGEKVSEIFPASVFTRTQLFLNRTSEQFGITLNSYGPCLELRIEIGVVLNHAHYKYDLLLHRKIYGQTELLAEKLSVANIADPDSAVVLCNFETSPSEHGGTNVQGENKLQTVFDVAGNLKASIPSGRARSFLSELQENDWSLPHIVFREALKRTAILKPDVTRMVGVSQAESEWLKRDCSNFADWYRGWVARFPERAHQMSQLLKSAIPGFNELRVLPAGEHRLLQVEFNHSDNLLSEFRLEELSEGQRMMILLAALAQSKEFDVLLLDEPDNFVAPGEVGPFLNALVSDFEGSASQKQLIVISHHPRSIDRLASWSAILFSVRAGLTQIALLKDIDLDGVPLSEAMLDQVV